MACLQWPSSIRPFRNEKGTEAEMRPAIVSGIVTGGHAGQLLANFYLSLTTIPEVFAKVNSAQSPCRFLRGELIEYQ